MAPPKYKVTYFDARGIVEPLRFMFAYKEVSYDDHRISKENDWPALKPKTPFGKLPILEFDGHVLAESTAINRYMAKELGLYGKTSLEGATIDMYIDAFKDTFSNVRTFIMEEDAVKKAEGAKKFFTETLPPLLEKLDHYLKKNGGQYYVGSGYTWADFSIAHGFKELSNRNAAALEKFPLLAKHVDAVHALPQIKAWVEKRPKTEF